MPIYEYCCQECGHSLEALQKLADAPLTDCPACSQPALKKQVSAPSFRLSGGGWYETDFKTGDKKNVASSDSVTAKSADKPSGKSESGTSKSDAGSSKSKPDAKPATKSSAA